MVPEFAVVSEENGLIKPGSLSQGVLREMRCLVEINPICFMGGGELTLEYAFPWGLGQHAIYLALSA